MNKRAYQIVADKRAWEGPPEPGKAVAEKAIGSKGWHTRGDLPHYDTPGTIQMVTFRLGDAMPASRRSEWEAFSAIEDERERRTQLEAYLDRGCGECLLRQPRVAAALEEVFLRYDGMRYQMIAWVVMPNHVHLLFELWAVPLGRLVKSWKSTSARAVNVMLGRSGSLWQIEYWDRYMRDEEHCRKARHSIEWNPVKAGLVRTPEQWPFSSANPDCQWSNSDRPVGAYLVRRARHDIKGA